MFNRKIDRTKFYGILDGLFGVENKNKKDTSNDNLEPWKKDYEPYNFEEEELEDDDYYYEDDNDE